MTRGADLARSEAEAVLDAPPRTPCPTVVLRHELPGGDAHYDWMLAIEPAGVEPLVTFRMGHRVDELSSADGGAAVAAEMIGRHRPAYLAYEGPLSGNRGNVTRLRRGVVKNWAVSGPTDWRLVIRWEPTNGRNACTQELLLRAEAPDMMHWQVRIA